MRITCSCCQTNLSVPQNILWDLVVRDHIVKVRCKKCSSTMYLDHTGVMGADAIAAAGVAINSAADADQWVTVEEKTYEMNWDCQFCGTRGLLGLTHRNCPNCGAPQDPTRRYYPPDDQKVAVQDHKYAGADVVCPACQSTNGKLANCCSSCGSPLNDAAAVQIQQWRAGATGTPGTQGAPPMPSPGTSSGTKAGLGLGCIVAVVIGLIVVTGGGFLICSRCGTTDASFQVSGHSSTCEWPAEVSRNVKETTPCSKMPAEAQNVSRQAQEPVCKVEKEDNGDGTYKESKKCNTPEDNCTYTVTKWETARSEKTEGTSVDTPAKCQKPTLQTGERLGTRTITYRVSLTDVDTKKAENCDFVDKDDSQTEMAKWKAFKVGSQWKGKRSGLGKIVCNSLIAE